MSVSLITLANVLSSDCTYYAGDPNLLSAERYTERIKKLLQSEQGDLLAVRVAIHAQLRDAFKDDTVQKMLRPYLRRDENFQTLIDDARSRAKFFSRKQQELQEDVMASEQQAALREAHRELATWERENAVLLRHQMFMTYKPSTTLLLESAATIALYRQYSALEEGEYTSDSSSGEVPAQLRKMAGKSLFTVQNPSKPLEVDEHTKMYSQQVLQNKRVEYEEKRALVAQRRKDLEECSLLKRLQEFINTRNDILRMYGIDRLLSLRVRKDKALAEPFEGGVDATVRELSPKNDIMRSRRVAQYSLAKIVEQCYKNYVSIFTTEDWEKVMKDGDGEQCGAMQTAKALRDLEIFRYWFLASITADAPQIGPNKLVGKSTTTVDEYKKLWQPQKTSYVPTINSSNRQQFMNLAQRRGFPHIVILSPVTYSYMQNNNPDTVVKGEFDMIVYDQSNKKVLLMIINSHDERRPRGAFLHGQEERYRFAAVIRTAITNENKLHEFKCQGTVAEYFFDFESGSEENYYCIMAPLKISQRAGMTVNVPLSALYPFTTCPPRYFLLGSNWGVGFGNAKNPYAMSFTHNELNEEAIVLQQNIPEGFVQKELMPHLLTREEGLEIIKKEKEQQQRELMSSRTNRSVAQTPRNSTSRTVPLAGTTGDMSSALADGDEWRQNEEHILPEEEDPLAPVLPDDVLRPVREVLLKKRFPQPDFLRRRLGDRELKNLSAVKEGQLRTPFMVFVELMKLKHGEDWGEAEEASSCQPRSARNRLNCGSKNGVKNHNATTREGGEAAADGHAGGAGRRVAGASYF